jgi:outer membrane protein OmpA-like peptidoglycan-associated protein
VQNRIIGAQAPPPSNQEFGMQQLIASTLRSILLFAAAAAALLAGGCAQPGPSSSTMNPQPFDDAVNAAIDDLFAQTQKLKLPAFMAKLESKIAPKRSLMVDPVLEANSSEQTTATQAIDARIAERVASQFPEIEVLPFQAANLGNALYLLTGTMSRTGDPTATGGSYQIDLSLTELKTRSVVAHSSSRARAQGVDVTPTAYYRDNPVLMRDGAVERKVAAARSQPGAPASGEYIDQLPSSMLLAEATNAYNADKTETSLTLYRQALAAPGGDQIRVHIGIYLANWKLGRVSEAEQAFGRVVALGLANRTLGVKFLFKTNSTEFWPDPRVSSAYEFWLRQIARQVASSAACLHVVGHTSRTGGEQYNDQLSLRRAQFIKQRLEAESPDLGSRTRTSGMGFRQNLVGTGTDDVRDALDRRVEFKVEDCETARKS